MFFLFLWKTFKCKKYKKNQILIDFFFPVVTLLFILYKYNGEVTKNETTFDPMTEERLYTYFPSGLENKILYTPNTEFYVNLMEEVRLKLEAVDERFIDFSSEKELNQYIDTTSTERIIVVIFNNNVMYNATLPKLDYTIRIKNNNYKTDKFYLNDIDSSNNKETDEYIESGFVTIQHIIDRSYIEAVAKYNAVVSIAHNPFISTKTNYNINIIIFTYIFVGIYFVITGLTILLPTVEEKEIGFTDYLKTATTCSYLNEFALFFLNFLINCICVAIIITASYYCNLWRNICVIYPIILILLYLIALICYSFFISSFFNSVKICFIGGFLYYTIPPIILFYFYNKKFISQLAFLSHTNNLFDGMYIFDYYISTNRVFNQSAEHFNKLLSIYWYLIFDTFIYLFLYYYLSNIHPGVYGSPKPYTFIFDSFNNYVKSKNKVTTKPSESASTASLQLITQKNAAVHINRLCKTHNTLLGKKTKAVDDLSATLFENEITVLLGHNGAGKSTTIAMLMGSQEKTNGQVSVYGNNNVNEYRSTMGYCPQHDVFLSYLTCREHIYFFGRLRGLSSKEIKSNVNNVLLKLNLDEKRDDLAYKLSGGMKRRLSLANAVIGKTKLIILDEPSSGLDPVTRRDLWNLLIKLRTNNTILITTHFMEEADVLGDRILIMENGKLLANGTSMELKKQHGKGYTLSITILNNPECKYSFNDIKNIVRNYVQNAYQKQCKDQTLTMLLPYEEQNNYSELLDNLYKEKEKLRIDYISLKNSTLEDVFLNISSSYKEDNTDTIDSRKNIAYSILKSKENIIKNQCFAIMYKKLLFLKHYWLKYLFVSLMPIIALIISITIISSHLNISSTNELHINANSNAIINNMIKYLTGKATEFGNINDNKSIYVAINDNDYDKYKYQKFIDLLEKETFSNYISLKIFYNQTINDVLLNAEKTNYKNYYENILAAYEVTSADLFEIKIIYFGNIIHSLPIGINFINNIVLKMNNGDAQKLYINTINKPMKRTRDGVDRSLIDIYLQIMPLGVFFYMLSYIWLPFNEQSSGFRTIQKISPWTYWSTIFLFDILYHCLYCVILFGCYQFDFGNIINNEMRVTSVLIFLFYGFACLPIIYATTHMFDSIPTVYTFLTYIHLISIFLANLTSGSIDDAISNRFLNYYLYLIPDYAMRQVLMVLGLKCFSVKKQALVDDADLNDENNYNNKIDNIFSTDFIKYYIYMIIIALFTFIFILILTLEHIYRKEKLRNAFDFKYFICKLLRKKKDIEIDSCVMNEIGNQASVSSASNTIDPAFKLTKLHKIYNKEVHAVKGISLSVNKGECFGLLGTNGAGKSTILKMTTLQETITDGNIHLNNRDCKKNWKSYTLQYGYCPQQNALCNYMTSYQMLKYVLWLRGKSIQYNDNETEIKFWLQNMDIKKYSNVKASNYSGGTKRKLSTALAMIGNKPIVILDEPTSGVDPRSQRFLWDIITEMQQLERTIILTSHSMQECEILCKNIGIICNGEIKTIGTLKDIKRCNNCGVVLQISLKRGNNSKNLVKNKIKSNFEAELYEEYGDTLKYRVQIDDSKLAYIFGFVYDLSIDPNYGIDDFFINDTGLEDIFICMRKNGEQV